MATKSQFLLLGIGEKARIGGNVRVLGTAADEQEAVGSARRARIHPSSG